MSLKERTDEKFLFLPLLLVASSTVGLNFAVSSLRQEDFFLCTTHLSGTSRGPTRGLLITKYLPFRPSRPEVRAPRPSTFGLRLRSRSPGPRRRSSPTPTSLPVSWCFPCTPRPLCVSPLLLFCLFSSLSSLSWFGSENLYFVGSLN